MREELLGKPPVIRLPPSAGLGPPLYQKFSEGKPPHRFSPKYDTFNGILKKVSDMKINGSLDSEEPSTESEKSEFSASGSSKPCSRSGAFSFEDRSNGSCFEDGSSTSSYTDNDHCLPYEEIPRVRLNRYSCVSLTATAPQPLTKAISAHLRDDFPPPPSPTDLLCSHLTDDRKKNWRQAGSFRELSIPPSVLDKKELHKNSLQQIFTSDINDNSTKFKDRKLSIEEAVNSESIADHEKHQMELFFKSLKTEVFVCGSPANLYFGWKEKEGNWTYRHTGVVVVILDWGDTRSRSKRRIQIILAERGTSFPLWKDTIDNLSAYRKTGTAFHTMHLSSDHRQIVGFSFDSPSEAEKLIKHIEELTSDPENINISVPGAKNRKKGSVQKKKFVSLPHKKHISHPCLFQHVTSVAVKDKAVYMSLQTLIDKEIVKKKENIS